MALGATTISGAYDFTSTSLAAAETFIESIITTSISGAQVFIIPSSNTQQYWIGITEQRN